MNKAGHFVVRNVDYPHKQGYPQQCAQALEHFCAEPLPDDWDDLLRVLASSVKYSYPDSHGFGVMREEESSTNLNGGENYLPYAMQIVDKQLAHDMPAHAHRPVKWTRTYVDDASDPPIPLTRVVRSGVMPEQPAMLDIAYLLAHGSVGGVRFEHALTPENPYYMAAKDAFLHAYAAATGMGPLPQGQTHEDAALHSYFLFSHIMPFTRGSATAAKLLWERLAKEAGFQTYPTPPLCDMNLEALTHDWSEFKALYHEGKFSDKTVENVAVLAEQKAWAQPQPKQRLGEVTPAWQKLAERVFTLAENPEASLYSTQDAILSAMLCDERQPHAKRVSASLLVKKYAQAYPSESTDLKRLQDTVSKRVRITLGNVSYVENGHTVEEEAFAFDGKRSPSGGALALDALPLLQLLAASKMFHGLSASQKEVLDFRIPNAPDQWQITRSGKAVQGVFQARGGALSMPLTALPGF